MTGQTVRPMGDYATVRFSEGLFFTAGFTPRVDGVLQSRGRVGIDVLDADAQHAARLATENLVSVLTKSGASGISPLSLTVYVACDETYTEHSRIADACSALIEQAYGTVPARAAVGVSSLPGGASIEVSLIGSFRALASNHNQ